jgi:hypothetical protein
MALEGHDPVCTVIHTSKGRTNYTCLNCIQAGYARADERIRIISALTGLLVDPDIFANDWEVGYRKGVKKAIDSIQRGSVA